MDCPTCKKGRGRQRMTKLYRHWNQYHKGKQWEHVAWFCPQCNTLLNA